VIKPVDEEAFPNLAEGFNPPVVPPVGLRQDPGLLAPLELEVNAASGLWAFDDPAVFRDRALEAAAKAQREAKEEEERQRQMEEDDERGRGRGRGRRGEEGFGGEGFGGRGGYGGMAGFEMTDDGAVVIRPNMAATPGTLADIRSESWVAVLAKVPIKQQVDKYKEALANASGYSEQYDMPKYIGYQVQRAEVTDEGTQEWQNLEKVLKATIIAAMERRPIEPPELADPRYTHPLLTWPLPPMVLRAWGEEVTHSDLPIASPESMYADEMAMAEQPEQPQEDAEGDEFAAQMRREAAAAAPTGPYSREGVGPMSPFGRGGEPPSGYGFRGEMGGEFGRGSYGYGGEMAIGRGEGAYANLPDKPWDMKTKYYLFRYYDSNVQPGHRYRYRVRLALADVNADSPERRVPERLLDKTVMDRKATLKDKSGRPLPYRVTEWSEPSPVAAVPQPGLIYMAQVKPSANVATEPQAQVLVKSLDAERVQGGAEVGRADFYFRGSVVNRLGEKAQVIWSSAYDLNEERNRQSPSFDFITGVTLLDFTGGERLGGSRDLLAPARALVMDSTGRMRVEEELSDQRPIREYNIVIEEAKKAIRNRQDEDRGGRGEDRGGRGGRGRGRR
jgi:hypothetical protein